MANNIFNNNPGGQKPSIFGNTGNTGSANLFGNNATTSNPAANLLSGNTTPNATTNPFTANNPTQAPTGGIFNNQPAQQGINPTTNAPTGVNIFGNNANKPAQTTNPLTGST